MTDGAIDIINESTPNKGGRPTKREEWNRHIAEAVTKLNPEVVNELAYAFAIGASIREACAYANISVGTYYNWTRANPKLLQHLENIKEKLPLKAKDNIAKGINAGDVSLSKWLMERTQADVYGEKTTLQHEAVLPTGAHPEDDALRLEYKQKLMENIEHRWKSKQTRQQAQESNA